MLLYHYKYLIRIRLPTVTGSIMVFNILCKNNRISNDDNNDNNNNDNNSNHMSISNEIVSNNTSVVDQEEIIISTTNSSRKRTSLTKCLLLITNDFVVFVRKYTQFGLQLCLNCCQFCADGLVDLQQDDYVRPSGIFFINPNTRYHHDFQERYIDLILFV